MRKYVVPFLSLFLDFIWINAVVGLAIYLVPSLPETAFGGPLPWSAQIVISLVLLSISRLLNLSLGEYLLSYAVAEWEAGVRLRQWPNLLLGTVGVLSGVNELVRGTEPGTGVPFLFMVEETPLKMVAITVYGALFGLGGIMLLRFATGAKLLNGALLASGVFVMAVNILFYHDAMVAAIIARNENQGRLITLEAAERAVALSPYGFVLLGVMAAILYFCRERPAAP
ncbi:membrane hypothetical protein [Mesorhizobium prunaredense]|uniref:Transmembrane protein n=1 Tax=Mesorhizobium prunaredense TaxID=1631249 RepID=A0A1R3V841_9HYPH|nr:hypothetical protein [Mesorhizobium prunaredense]SIT54535.1 membrane hypothetical protein [Mesorhizobium prunaredense]